MSYESGCDFGNIICSEAKQTEILIILDEY
jgi:hypothetical protein